MIDAVASATPNGASLQQGIPEGDTAAFEASTRAASKEVISPGQAALHAGLNVASLVPGEGIAAELANAGLWASEGHAGHALLDAGLAFVPGGHELGSAFGLLRAGVKVASGGEGVLKAETEKLGNGSSSR